MGTEADIETQPIVSLTDGAAAHVKSLMTEQPENTGKVLRIYVESGGCSGMQYGMVFDEERPNDLISESHGVTVLVDPLSADHLAGTLVDYVDELTGGGFKISNPKARHSCGCGKSFEA
jgi:iron-sulfur cluster assembly accessory protein